MHKPVPPTSSSALAEVRARLRWRARRGLLENDLILQNFFDHYEHTLSDEDVQALSLLFEETDNHLLDLFLGRAQPTDELNTPAVQRVLGMIRSL